MTDEEVLDALQYREKFVDEMLLALLDSAEKRGLTIADAAQLRTEITARIEQEKQAEAEAMQSDAEEVEMVPDGNLPVLYSQTAILGFTIFFSPIFGGIMLAMNAARLRKPNIWQIILLSLVLAIGGGLISWYVFPASLAGILIPVGSGLLLSELVWNRFIGKGLPYLHRKILVPLLIALAITLPIAYVAYQNPEIFNIQPIENEK